jgi:pyridoxamine 5'-phosphate oxidase
MADKVDSSIAGMRADYQGEALRRKNLDPNPFIQFHIWFEEARQAGILEPNAMILSTMGLDLIPSSRTVLLKELDKRGFTFFTNYTSRKAREIFVQPVAGLLFLWKEQARQVAIRGQVEQVSREESQVYFNSRPYASRIGAWVSEQSQAIPNREWLETRDQEMRGRFPDTGTDHCVPIPEFWGGYRVLPSSIEFWQGATGRLHDRFVYTHDHQNHWKIERLSP